MVFMDSTDYLEQEQESLALEHLNDLDGELTNRAKMFCKEYIIDFCSSRAALAAGYSKHTCKQIGSRLLRSDKIQLCIAQLMQERNKRLKVDADMIVAELMRIGFSDPRKVMSWDSEGVYLKASSDLTDDEAALVNEVSYKETKDGMHVSVKMHDKISALDKLARHVGLYNKDTIEVKKVVSISDEDKAILERLGVAIDD